ncbi:ABC transporter permease [Conexibacter woesei]|uniref:Binding-protein-dependent transport systems inner membrane component n=1 Tax=Conexibacter woesei (strain DSM 14684 / CCUG 47730 / CIP 108061 / JCM 11494 / NBRC 100937 / ID131577) TaxID=469383 RepID=D3FDA4_CONWI|nr:ABC transporter permease [Conexibacter woesei]ADB53496.1 binding-protein-dependent transport systems inner membrane component [Conexibacter woesei DSM 14684]
MSRYLAGRVLEMVPVVVCLSFAAFMLIHLVPGDPATAKLGIRGTPEQIAAFRAQLGLDQSLPQQYWHFISGALTFDFGESIRSQEDVGELIGRRLQPSFLLVGYALLIAIVVAVPLATIAAVRRRSWVDQLIRLLSTVGFVMPSFWLALLLVNLFSVQLGVFPTSGYGDTFSEHLRSLTLPALTIGLGLAPLLLRLLRDSEIETLQSEYVGAARARGLSEPRVLAKHVLRNSATSTVTLLGVLAGVLLSATVIVEQIFAIPGLGSLLVTSVRFRDYPVVQALTLLFGIVVVVAGLLADLVYAYLDPRVRL